MAINFTDGAIVTMKSGEAQANDVKPVLQVAMTLSLLRIWRVATRTPFTRTQGFRSNAAMEALTKASTITLHFRELFLLSSLTSSILNLIFLASSFLFPQLKCSGGESYDDIDNFKSSHDVKSIGDSEEITRGPDYVLSVRIVAFWVCTAVASGVGLGLKDGVGRASEFFAGYEHDPIY